MVRKSLISVLLSAAMLLSLSSCKEDPAYSYPPTWKGFTYFPYAGGQYGPERGQLYPGDSLAVRAVQNNLGSNLAGTSYRWIMDVDTFSTADPTKHEMGQFHADYWYPTDHIPYSTPEGMTDPEGYFRLPQNIHFSGGVAYLTIHFDVSYQGFAEGIALKDATTHVAPYLGSISNTYGSIFMGSGGMCRDIVVSKK